MLAGPSQAPQANWSVVTSNGTIVAVGPADAIRAAHPNARVIDVHGTTVMPGLTDAHGHLYGLGLSLDTVNVVGAPSYDEVDRARARARAARAAAANGSSAAAGIRTAGRTSSFRPRRRSMPRSPIIPSGSAASMATPGIANSAAMRAAGITAATPDPEGGRILRDAAGNPTGVFIDGAMHLIDSKVPAPSPSCARRASSPRRRRSPRTASPRCTTPARSSRRSRAIQQLIDEHKFPIRVYVMLTDEATLLDAWLTHKPLIGYGDRLTVRAVKMYADGALGSRGAALLAPYSDDPSNSGLLRQQAGAHARRRHAARARPAIRPTRTPSAIAACAT